MTIRIVFDRNESQENVKRMAIEVLDEILKFSISHGLTLSSDKTQGMIVAKKQIREKCQDLQIIFDNEAIKFEPEMELLGVTITNDLSQEKLVNERVAKTMKAVAS